MKERKIDDELLLQMIGEGKQQKEIAEYFGCSPVAVHKRLKRLSPVTLPESVEKLTDKRRKFCIAIAEGETRTNAVMKSFEVTSRQSAKVMGSHLMSDPDIQTAIQDLMAEEGLTRRYRVQRLKSCIDHKDPNVVLKGLDTSFKLDGSYAPEKHTNVSITIKTVSAAAYCNRDDCIDVSVNQSENHDAPEKALDDISFEAFRSPYPHRSED
jgi:DNA-binding MarR family transcriptional regulator